MKLKSVHQDSATRTRAGAPGIKAAAIAHNFAPAGASLGLNRNITAQPRAQR